MAEVRIFSYLPNPCVRKEVIAARICGVDLELGGVAGAELVGARPLSEVCAKERTAAERLGRIGFNGRKLYKTDPFLAAQPFGTVPAAFSGDGQVGIVEPNSIMRAVARQALVGEGVSLADICFACELGLFHNELDRSEALIAFGKARFLDKARERFPRGMAHFDALRNPAFAPELSLYLAKFATER